ncbi:MAG: DUF4032 domain-containing protein [Trueperaceae bacterium]|nr:DUF4032 domain-containing protein [Trueperaceae bacterium]
MESSQRARHDAERLRGRAFWNHIRRSLRGLPNELLPFDTIRKHFPLAEAYSGVQTIPIKNIVGSVDRYRDFDFYFLPRLSLPLNRWIGIRAARLEGKELPPIQVYKLGELYFVKDGHHRVSVGREDGQLYIDAEIIELKVPVALSEVDSLKELIIKGEYSQFLEHSRLKHLRPDHEPILFTVTGRYDLLLEHIITHQYYLAREHSRAFSWDEAVMSWYDTVYTPVVEEIKRFKVLDRFPGRNVADLYIWIMDHRHFVRQSSGQEISTYAALKDYSARYAPGWFQRLVQRVKLGWQRSAQRRPY